MSSINGLIQKLLTIPNKSILYYIKTIEMSEKTDKIIAGLKDLAKIALGSEEVKTIEAKFTDAKLSDGTIVRYDEEELAQGIIVSVVDESGNVLPLPIGSYELEDGTTFDVVDDSGIIDNIVMGSGEADGEMENNDKGVDMEEKAPVTKEAEQAVKSVVETVSKETRFEDEAKKETKVEAKTETKVEVKEDVLVDESFASVKAEFKKDLDALTEKFEAQSKLLTEMFELIDTIGKEEAIKTPETKTNVFKANKRMTVSKEDVRAAKQSFRDQLSGKA